MDSRSSHGCREQQHSPAMVATLETGSRVKIRLTEAVCRVRSHPPTSHELIRFHGQKNGRSGDVGRQPQSNLRFRQIAVAATSSPGDEVPSLNGFDRRAHLVAEQIQIVALGVLDGPHIDERVAGQRAVIFVDPYFPGARGGDRTRLELAPSIAEGNAPVLAPRH